MSEAARRNFYINRTFRLLSAAYDIFIVTANMVYILNIYTNIGKRNAKETESNFCYLVYLEKITHKSVGSFSVTFI